MSRRTLAAAAGARVDLAEFAGKPVVVNVWASWCAGHLLEVTGALSAKLGHRA